MSSRRRIMVAGLVAVAVTTATILPHRPALAVEAIQRFDIPAGDLGPVLTQIGAASGRAIAFPASLTKGLRAGPIRGAKTARAAIAEALAGTGLVQVGDETGPVTVRAARRGEVLDGGVVVPAAGSGGGPGVSPTGGAGLDLPDVDVIGDRARFGDRGFQAGEAGQTTRLGDAPAREVPIAVTSVTQEVLRSQSITSPTQALDNVSGLSQSPTNIGENTFDIRGFKVQQTFIDGDPSQGSFYARLPIDVIERIDVLKGSTSLLSGVSQDGGLVNFVTKAPTDRSIRDLTVRYGSFGEKTAALDLGGRVPKTEGLTYRLNAVGNLADQSYGGYRSPHQYPLAPAIEWQDDTFKVLVGARVMDIKSALPNFTYVPIPAQTAGPMPPGGPGPMPPSGPGPMSPVGPGPMPPGGPGPMPPGGPGPMPPAASAGNVAVARLPRGVPFGGANLALHTEAQAVYSDQSVRLFANRDLEVTLNNHVQFQSQHTNENVLTFQQATAISGGPYVPIVASDAIDATDLAERADLTTKYDAGFFKQTAKVGVDVLESGLSAGSQALLQLAPTSNSQGGIPIAPGSVLHFSAPRSVIGAYHLEKIDTLNDRLHIVGSVRVDRFSDARDLYSTTGATFDRASQVGLSWIAGGAFDLLPWMTVYGNRANGFVGQTAITDASSKPAPAQGRDASEVGLRTFLFDKRLSLTTSFFTLEQTNVAVADAMDASGLLSVVVPGQKTRGVEFEAQGEVTENLNLILAFSDIHSAFQGLAGSSLMQAAPQLAGGVWATYGLKSGPLAGLFFGFGAHGNSLSLTGVALGMGGTGTVARIPGYVVEDATIGYARDDYSVSFKLNNITNRYFFDPSVVSTQIAIGEGRNFVLVARRSF